MTLKPGDRVAVYQGKRFVSEVLNVEKDGSVLIADPTGEGESWFVHPRQCRKLKPRMKEHERYHPDPGSEA